MLRAHVSHSGDALEDYLATPPIPGITDPIMYWNHRLEGSNCPLAQMALDYLSAPGMSPAHFISIFSNFAIFVLATSTDVERAFSRGGLTVSKLRHSLSDTSTQAATVLGSWCDKGLVPVDEIIADFKNKSSRARKKPRTAPTTPDVVIVESGSASTPLVVT